MTCAARPQDWGIGWGGGHVLVLGGDGVMPPRPGVRSAGDDLFISGDGGGGTAGQEHQR